MESTLKRIPLGQIKVNEVALRPAKIKDKAFQDLLLSVEAQGVIKPILVNDNGDGSYTLIDGLQRFTAAKMVREKNANAPVEIDAKVVKVNSEKELGLQIILNNNTIKTRPVEFADGIMRVLAHNPQLNQADLATQLGMSQPTLSNMLKLSKLAAPIQELVNDGSIRVTNAYLLARLDQDVQEQFLEAAQTDSPEVFTTKIKEFEKAERAKKANLPAPDGPSPVLRKRPEIQASYETLKATTSNQSNPSREDLIKLETLAWCLKLDPSSVQEWKDAKEKSEKEKAEKTLKAQQDREADAKKKSDEARAKLAAINS